MDAPDWLNYLSDRGFRFRCLDLLTRFFDIDEFKTLCFILNIDYDEIGGDTKSGKVRELILKMERESQIVGLIFAAKSLRPHDAWDMVLGELVESTEGDKNVNMFESVIIDAKFFDFETMHGESYLRVTEDTRSATSEEEAKVIANKIKKLHEDTKAEEQAKLSRNILGDVFLQNE